MRLIWILRRETSIWEEKNNEYPVNKILVEAAI